MVADPRPSNLNRWAPWYDGATKQQRYGSDDVAYQAAAEWLDGLAVQDWGCGYGWFRRFHNGPYMGIDGTRTPWCDLHVDLADYRSITPGLMLRGVLEHDLRWAEILDNAVASYTERLFIALFTPLQRETTVLVEDVAGLGVPDIGFALHDITDRLDDVWQAETVPTRTHYGAETLIRLQRG